MICNVHLVLTVAERWFGFCRVERMTIHIADGVSFINELVSANKHGEMLRAYPVKLLIHSAWLYKGVDTACHYDLLKML